MASEIARRLVNGIWRTGAVDESSGGGESPFVLVGPFPIDYTMGALSTCVELQSVDQGAIVLKAWAYATERWSDGTPRSFDVRLILGLGSVAEGDVTTDCYVDADFGSRDPALVGASYLSQQPDANVTDGTALAVAVGKFFAANITNFGGSPLTSGRADCYALIANPT